MMVVRKDDFGRKWSFLAPESLNGAGRVTDSALLSAPWLPFLLRCGETYLLSKMWKEDSSFFLSFRVWTLSAAGWVAASSSTCGGSCLTSLLQAGCLGTCQRGTEGFLIPCTHLHADTKHSFHPSLCPVIWVMVRFSTWNSLSFFSVCSESRWRKGSYLLDTCVGQFYVSTWIDNGVQVISQTPDVAMRCFL